MGQGLLINFYFLFLTKRMVNLTLNVYRKLQIKMSYKILIYGSRIKF